jgi:hypothetical protein
MTFPAGTGVGVGPPIGVGVLVGGFAASEVVGAAQTIRATMISIGRALPSAIANLLIVFLLMYSRLAQRQAWIQESKIILPGTSFIDRQA